MIVTRLDADKPAVIPGELLDALGLKAGDEIAIELVGARIVIAPANEWPDPFVNNFATFTEWASEEDKVFDNL